MWICWCFVCLILGLPIQVRDAGLSLKDEMPKSDVNKEYYTQNMEREVRKCSCNHTLCGCVKGRNDLAYLKSLALILCISF